MAPIREILVPLDGSRAAEASLDHARAVARPLDARLHLVRVVSSSRSDAARDPVAWRLERGDARSYVAETARRLRSEGFATEECVLPGRPAEETVAYARRNGVDLAVLTRTGAGGNRDAPMGGTAHKIVYGIGSSVLLAQPGPDGSSSGADGYRRIVVPLDGSPPSEWALLTAASLLADDAGELVAARALEPGGGGDGDARRREAESHLKRLGRRVAAPQMRLKTTVVSGDHVAGRLHAVADECQADLVAVSAHGRSGAAPWPYGSVATNLLLHGRRPTLVLQDQPELRRAAPPEREESARPSRTRRRRPESRESGGTVRP